MLETHSDQVVVVDGDGVLGVFRLGGCAEHVL